MKKKISEHFYSDKKVNQKIKFALREIKKARSTGGKITPDSFGLTLNDLELIKGKRLYQLFKNYDSL